MAARHAVCQNANAFSTVNAYMCGFGCSAQSDFPDIQRLHAALPEHPSWLEVAEQVTLFCYKAHVFSRWLLQHGNRVQHLLPYQSCACLRGSTQAMHAETHMRRASLHDSCVILSVLSL